MGNSTSSNPELSHFPPEITAEIFHFACDDHRQHVRNAMDDICGNYMTRYDKEKGVDRITGPVTLSQVCRAWKDFVYSTPALWDTVFVYIPEEGDRFGLCMTTPWLPSRSARRRGATYEDAAIKLTRWLDRSANCPVTVKIGGPYFPAAFEPLLKCSERWRDIDIYCLKDHFKLYARMEQVVKGPLPLLESFTCRANRCDHLYKEVHPTLSIKAAEKLKRISQFREVPLSFSRSGIEVGRWCGFTTSKIIDDLAAMINIRECAVYDVRKSITRPIPPIRLSQLENLELHWLPEVACDSLLPSLKLPFLRRFSFSNDSSPRAKASARAAMEDSKGGMDILSLLLSLILRSSSPYLQYLNLKICADTVQAEILLDILQHSPTLQQVDVTLVGFYRGALASTSIIQNAYAGTLIVLENLTSYYLDMTDLDSDNVEHTALLRHLTLPALKNFRVSFPRQKISSAVGNSQTAFLEAQYLIDRSNCSLTSLTLETHSDIPETKLLNFLTKLPTLEYLRLAGYSYDHIEGKNTMPHEMKFVVRSSLFELLIPPSRFPTNPIHLPKLREVIFEGIFAASLEEVFSVLELRLKGDTDHGIQRLTRVGIYYTQEFIEASEEKLLQRCSDLRLQGMDAVIRRVTWSDD